MKINARFEKVSYETWLPEFEKQNKWFYSKNQEKNPKVLYDNIKLPVRATAGSAGYDFFAPYYIYLPPEHITTIPTGIRVIMPKHIYLAIHPRSSLGFKFKLQLYNTTAIIDSDYQYADNEGHIFCKLYNDTPYRPHINDEVYKSQFNLELQPGDAFAQGIFSQCFLTEDDDVFTKRTGGIGSTSKKKEV